MTSIRSTRRRHVCTDPLHVVERPDGTVVMFFPDGRSVALTIDAAARSTMLLARAVRGANGGDAAPSGRTGKIIAVDFGAGIRVR